MSRKQTLFKPIVVVKPIDTGQYQTGHVLGARRLCRSIVLGRIQFSHQFHWIFVWQVPVPDLFRNSSGAGCHPSPVHKAAGGFQPDDHHGTRRRRVQLGHERLINPAASQCHSIWNPSDCGHLWHPFRNHHPRLFVKLRRCKLNILSLLSIATTARTMPTPKSCSRIASYRRSGSSPQPEEQVA